MPKTYTFSDFRARVSRDKRRNFSKSWARSIGSKFPENSGTESNVTENFEKFVPKILVGKFLFHLAFHVIPLRISARYRVLSPSRDCRVEDGGSQIFIDISVASVFSSDDLRSFDGICSWMTMGILHCPMLHQ